jgi:hypothetical protein
MKKIIALAFPFLVLVGAVITVLALEARRVPDWESELNSYIARSRLPGETITVLAQVEVSRPWNFSPAMGRAIANESGWPWGNGELPPPYPPTAVRCVLLEHERKLATGEAAEPLRQVIFVSYHSDGLWRAGWLTHEGPQDAFTPELMANLDAIGCDLGIKL